MADTPRIALSDGLVEDSLSLRDLRSYASALQPSLAKLFMSDVLRQPPERAAQALSTALSRQGWQAQQLIDGWMEANRERVSDWIAQLDGAEGRPHDARFSRRVFLLSSMTAACGAAGLTAIPKWGRPAEYSILDPAAVGAAAYAATQAMRAMESHPLLFERLSELERRLQRSYERSAAPSLPR